MTDAFPDDSQDPTPADFLPAAEQEELAKFDAELDLEPDEDVDEFAAEAAATQPEAVSELTAIEQELNAPGFYEAGVDLHALDDLNFTGRVSVLERLGPAHFRSKGFSFMGFLQTVYDHVAEELKKGPATDVAEPAAVQAATDVADAGSSPVPGEAASEPGNPAAES